MTKAQKRFPWKMLLRVGIVALVVGVCVVVLPKIDFHALKSALKNIDPFHLCLSLGGVTGLWLCRCLLLGRMLSLRIPFPLSKALSIGLMGGFMDQVIPARGGMVFRWAFIHRTTKATKSFVFSALITAFVLEGIGLLLLFLGVLAFDKSADEFSNPSLTFLFVIGLIGLLLMIPLSHYILDKTKGTFLERMRPLVALLEMASTARNPLRFLEWALIVAVMWVSNLWVAYELALAFHMALSLSQIIIMLFVINVAILIPAVPGNLGTMQVAITWILVRFGVAQSSAVAYSLVFHAIHVIPILLLGAALLIRNGMTGPIISKTTSLILLSFYTISAIHTTDPPPFV